MGWGCQEEPALGNELQTRRSLIFGSLLGDPGVKGGQRYVCEHQTPATSLPLGISKSPRYNTGWPTQAWKFNSAGSWAVGAGGAATEFLVPATQTPDISSRFTHPECWPRLGLALDFKQQISLFPIKNSHSWLLSPP